MRDLHEAVARAIADRFDNGKLDTWTDVAAAAAIRVVLAEATRGIEALDGYRGTPDAPLWVRADEVLAALAALGEQDALPE